MLQQFLHDSELIAKIAGLMRALTAVLFIYVLCKQIREFRNPRLLQFKIALTTIVVASLIFSAPSWLLTYRRAEGIPVGRDLANISVISSATSGLLAAAAFLVIYKKPKD